MHIERPIHSRRRLSLTSLIDVIFLLLLFFMLSSTFSKFAEIDVSATRSGTSANAEKPEILITLDGDSWRINGQVFDKPLAIGFLEEMVATQDRKAALLARGETSSQQLVSALEALASVARLQVMVAK